MSFPYDDFGNFIYYPQSPKPKKRIMYRLPVPLLLAVLACGSLGSQAYATISLPLNGGFDVSKPGTGGAVGGVVVGNFLKGVG